MKNKISPINLYCLSFFIIVAQTLLCSLVFNINIYNIFCYFYTHNEIGVDFFGLLIRNIKEPIAVTHPYPPFSYLLYYVLRNISLADSTLIYEKYQQLTHFLFLFLPLIITSFICLSELNKINAKNIYLFVLCILFSYPITGCISTANLSIIVLPFVCYYCFNYNSKDYKKFIAIICLAIGTSLKITPGVFSISLLWEKKIKDFVLFTIICILLFFLPILFFNNGFSYLDNLNNILNAAFGYTNIRELTRWGGGQFLFYIQHFISKIFNINYDIVNYASIVSKIFFAVAIYMSFSVKSAWMKFTLLTISHSFLGPQLTHGAVICIIPLLMYIIENNNVLVYKWLFWMLVLLILPFRIIPFIVSPHFECILHSIVMEFDAIVILFYIIYLNSRKKVV